MTHLLLWGNAYAQIIRNGKGEIIALYPLMPDRMTVDRDEKGRLYYQYTKSNDDAPTMEGSTVILNPSDVLHVLGLGFDGLVGYSPIAMAKNAIGLAIAAEQYGSKFYANGAAPSGVLEHPGTLKDPGRVRDSWNAAFGGISSCWTYRLFQRKISCAHQQAGDKVRWKSRFSNSGFYRRSNGCNSK